MSNLKKLLAVLFVMLGVVSLVYRNFAIAERSRSADLGPLEIRMKRRMNVPVWAGVALVVVGTGLLVYERKK